MRRKLTKEFKEDAVRRVEEGTPLKQVARTCGVAPPVVRAWRAEMRALGPAAFLRNDKRRKFDQQFKEGAVRRLTEGVPLKEVARGCGIAPSVLRQWRATLQGPDSMSPKSKSMTKAIIFRLTEEEYDRLSAIVKEVGERSLSSLVRSRVLGKQHA